MLPGKLYRSAEAQRRSDQNTMYSKLSSKTRSTSYFTDFARGKRVKKAHGRHSKILAWQTGTGLPASHSMQGPASALVSVDQASHQRLLLLSANVGQGYPSWA